MEKKSLGRALEDISHLFLSSSPADANQKGTDTGFWSVGIREETCASCIHLVESQDRTPRCRIFSFENEKYGVPHIENITYGHGRYCKFYARAQEGPQAAPSAENPVPKDALETEEGFDLEETIRITRKIAYPDSESGQKNMKAAILKYLQDGYEVRRVELRKQERVLEPGRSQTRDEVLTISIREDGIP